MHTKTIRGIFSKNKFHNHFYAKLISPFLSLNVNKAPKLLALVGLDLTERAKNIQLLALCPGHDM